MRCGMAQVAYAYLLPDTGWPFGYAMTHRSACRRSGEDMQQTQARDFNVDPKFTSWRTKYMAYIKTDG